jgi:hypothetical protein
MDGPSEPTKLVFHHIGVEECFMVFFVLAGCGIIKREQK